MQTRSRTNFVPHPRRHRAGGPGPRERTRGDQVKHAGRSACRLAGCPALPDGGGLIRSSVRAHSSVPPQDVVGHPPAAPRGRRRKSESFLASTRLQRATWGWPLRRPPGDDRRLPSAGRKRGSLPIELACYNEGFLTGSRPHAVASWFVNLSGMRRAFQAMRGWNRRRQCRLPQSDLPGFAN